MSKVMVKKGDIACSQQSSYQIDNMIFFGMLFVIGVLPLLTRIKLIRYISPIISEPLLNTGFKIDAFTYYKYIFLILLVIIIMGLFLYKMIILRYHLPSSYINIPVFILTIAILISLLGSDYHSLSLTGLYDRHEGTITYLCYIILFFIASNILFDENKLKYLIYALYPVTIINTVLGLVSFYNYDILKTSFIKSILLPSSIPENFIKSDSVFNSTLANPNYVSGFASFLIIVFFLKSLFETNIKIKGINMFFSVCSFVMLFSSLSTSGFFTFLCLFPVILVLAVILGDKKKNLLSIGLYIILISFIFILMTSYNSRVWNETIGFFGVNMTFKTAYDTQLEHSDLVDNSNPIRSSSNRTDMGRYYIEKMFGLPTPGYAPGSGRLYIWKQTIELIKYRPLFGYGLDTLAYYFPQNGHDYGLIIDKPHSIYLDLAYGSGIIALISFISLIFIHMFKCIKFLTSTNQIQTKLVLIVMLTGWLAYLIQGLFNDSIIGTAPIFWILFGFCVSTVNNSK